MRSAVRTSGTVTARRRTCGWGVRQQASQRPGGPPPEQFALRQPLQLRDAQPPQVGVLALALLDRGARGVVEIRRVEVRGESGGEVGIDVRPVHRHAQFAGPLAQHLVVGQTRRRLEGLPRRIERRAREGRVDPAGPQHVDEFGPGDGDAVHADEPLPVGGDDDEEVADEGPDDERDRGRDHDRQPTPPRPSGPPARRALVGGGYRPRCRRARWGSRAGSARPWPRGCPPASASG